MSRRARWFLPVVFLVALLLGGGAAAAQTSVPTLRQYQAAVQQAADTIAAAPPRDAPALVKDAAARLAEFRWVALPTGYQTSVEPLLKGTESRDIALARLRLVGGQLAASANDHSVERLAALDAILARPEFRDSESLVDRFLRWLAGLLPNIGPEAQAAGSEALRTALTVAGGVIALVIVIVLVQSALRNFVAGAEARRADGEGERLTAEAARQQATEQARGGNYREAVRSLYLATLLTLEERGLLRYDRSLTNREVLRALPPGSPVQENLEPVVETFERVWYGVREPDEATYAAYAGAVATASEAIRVAERPAAPRIALVEPGQGGPA